MRRDWRESETMAHGTLVVFNLDEVKNRDREYRHFSSRLKGSAPLGDYPPRRESKKGEMDYLHIVFANTTKGKALGLVQVLAKTQASSVLPGASRLLPGYSNPAEPAGICSSRRRRRRHSSASQTVTLPYSFYFPRFSAE